MEGRLMLFGTASAKSIDANAPEVEIDETFALDAGRVEWVQFTYELSGDRLNLDILPPGLHPTTPIVATLQLWRGAGGELGDFGLAQLRLTCRAGMRIRAYLLQSVIDGDAASEVLTRRFGYGPQRGSVFLRTRADRIDGRVEVDGRPVLDATLIEPQAVDLGAIQHITSMHPARTAAGLTLLQVDPEFVQTALRRGDQRLNAMDTDFWRLEGRRLKYPVIAVAGEAQLRLPPVLYTTEPFPKSPAA
jgi:hypothetical protein